MWTRGNEGNVPNKRVRREYHTAKTQDPTEAAGAIDRFRGNTTSSTILFVVLVLSPSYTCVHSVELSLHLQGIPRSVVAIQT